MAAPSPERVLRVLRPVIEGAGVDVETIDITPAGRRRLLRVVIDKDGGITLDDVATVSQGAAQALDESDVMGTLPYVLEVTSPGVDRPLTEPRHWRRAVGRKVSASLSDGSTVQGRVVDAAIDWVQLDVDGAPRVLSYADVERASVEVEFNRPGAADLEDNVDEEI